MNEFDLVNVIDIPCIINGKRINLTVNKGITKEELEDALQFIANRELEDGNGINPKKL